jgi:hypothetical protein
MIPWDPRKQGCSWWERWVSSHHVSQTMCGGWKVKRSSRKKRRFCVRMKPGTPMAGHQNPWTLSQEGHIIHHPNHLNNKPYTRHTFTMLLYSSILYKYIIYIYTYSLSRFSRFMNSYKETWATQPLCRVNALMTYLELERRVLSYKRVVRQQVRGSWPILGVTRSKN